MSGDIVSNFEIILNNLNQKNYAYTKDSCPLTDEEKAFIRNHRPDSAFIAYGTLAPNRPNHHVIAHINGTWRQGIIRGQLENIGWGANIGYAGFKLVGIEEQNIIKAYVLFSDKLAQNWGDLDEFEGEEYKRILAKFELDNGKMGVGHIYALNELS